MQGQETFTVQGVTPDVNYARAAAWNALRQILGNEPEDLWEMFGAAYTICEVDGEDGIEVACKYEITLVRVREEVEA